MHDDPAPLNTHELIAALCLEAGRIMEDTSSELALGLPDDEGATGARLQTARAAAEEVLAMLAAAQALHRRLVSDD